MSASAEEILRERLPKLFSESLGLELCSVDSAEFQGARSASSVDAYFEVDLGATRRLVAVVVKTGDRRESMERIARATRDLRDRAADAIPLLVAPRLGDAARRELREAEINYADFEGHIYIWDSGIRIWLERPATRRSEKPASRGGRRPNPFSKRASFVLRALLEAPSRSWGVREISSETGLSAGYTSDVVSELVRRGYAAGGEGGFSLEDPVRALFDWTRVYRWDQNAIHSFTVAYEPDELAGVLRRGFTDAGVKYASTLLAGTDVVARHVQHSQMHVYIPPERIEDARAVVSDRLYGEEVRSGGNLHVLGPYYARSAFYGVRHVGGVPVVSNVQLFLDLVHYPLRGLEAAAKLVRTALRQQLHLSREQVRSLVTLIGGD